MPALSLLTRGMVAPVGSVVRTVLRPPAPVPTPFVQPLDLPAAGFSAAEGIVQPDILIRSAIVLALADLRSNQTLLSTVFANLRTDTLTREVYGEKEQDRAASWIKETDVPVVMDYRLAPAQGTCVSITLLASDEAEPTLADVHYDPTSVVEPAWAPVAGPFNPVYDPATGLVTVSAAVAAQAAVAEGMLLVDSAGGSHKVLSVLSPSQFYVEPGIKISLRRSILRTAGPRLTEALESLRFRETYRIGVHAHGDPMHLMWLHSAVVFCLLRYKQALLEARGFERSTLSSSAFARDTTWEQEVMWSRYINLTGYVQQTWPKLLTERGRTLDARLVVEQPGPGGAVRSFPGTPDALAAWLARDSLG